MRPPPPSEILALAATVSDEAQKLRQANAAAKGKAASSAAEFEIVNGNVEGAAIIDNGNLNMNLADDDGAAAGGERLSARRGPSLRLPPPPDCGQVPVALEGASFGWPPRGADGGAVAPVATEVDFEITKGMRVIVRGPNGAGKSTLARALAGTLPLAAGARVADERLALGYFTQDLSQELDPEASAVELVLRTVREKDPRVSEQTARGALGALGLSGPMALRKVGALSGGEKARVALAIFALTPSNVLILDEPSNHLDVDAIAALVGALDGYAGAVLVVSHDRAFCEALAPTHVATVRGGAVRLEARRLEEADWAIEGRRGA